MNKIIYPDDGPPRMVIQVNGVEKQRECYIEYVADYCNAPSPQRAKHVAKHVPVLRHGERLIEQMHGDMFIVTVNA